MNYQHCSKTSIKLFPEHYQVINGQKEFPAASSKTVVFTPFLTGSCRDFSCGVKYDIGNRLGLQIHPSSAKKY